MANTTPLVTTVMKPTIDPGEANTVPRVNIQELCEEYYEDILPIIMEKARHERLKDVHAMLDFGEGVEKASEALKNHTVILSPTPIVTKVITIQKETGPRHPACRGVIQAKKNTSSRKTRMPNNIKTYDGTRDPEDHVKVFQAAAQVERWATPTWCHMFNSTLIGAARVWFDELPPESIDGYKDMKAAFLTFMHGINNLELTKRLNEHIPMIMEEMMIATTAFRTNPRSMQIKGLIYKVTQGTPPPPMVTPVEKRNSNKFCDFHNDKGHSTDECMQLKKQTEEFVRAGKLSYLIKEIKQGREQPKTGRKEAAAKDKPMTIYMRRDYMAARTTKTPGNQRRCHPFYQSIDELHDCKVVVALQRSLLILAECASIDTSSTIPREKKTRPANLTVPLHPNFLDQEVVVGGSLSDKGRTELCALLKKNLDIFAWQPSNMTRVPRSIAEHRLNIREGCPPMRQKKSGQAPERTKAIQAEVQKLVEARIMREDCYPLPKIDWKVESLCGYHFKCFLNAYKGYHQIQLAAADEEKTAFHTRQGVYCYTKMPFGLKNAGATHIEAEMVKDIDETFQILRKINMKLNPKKYSFGLTEGVFLGYVITPEGIKSCPNKTTVIEDVDQRTNLADILNEMPSNASQGVSVAKTKKEPWMLFTNGSSCVDGFGAGLILTNPDGVEFTYALRFQFAASNNKAEYEALIAGLRIATQIGVKNIQANVDSKLVANQVLRTYVAKEDNMIKYLEIAKGWLADSKPFQSAKYHGVLVEVLETKSITCKEVTTVIKEEGPTWMTELVNYLKEGILLRDEKEVRNLRLKARQYELIERVLYKQSFLTPWLRCVGPLQAEYVIKEIHEGSCSMHAGPWSVVAKAIRLGYFWPAMHKDAQDMIRRCPFSKRPRKVKFLIVAMVTSQNNGKQFADNPFKDWCDKLNITQHVASVKHSQSNGLVERANRSWGKVLRHSWEKGIRTGMPTYRTTAVDVVNNDEELRLNIDLLEERQELIAMSKAKSKSKMMKYYNSRVRGVAFKPGDFVYRGNDGRHVVAGGKLRPK
nr:reverse transcriptase domain-containing protein [Tanacetum cinerariifolium]